MVPICIDTYDKVVAVPSVRVYRSGALDAAVKPSCKRRAWVIKA